jgi:DNA replication protein DnaC
LTRETYGLRCSRCIDDELHQFYLDEEVHRLELADRRIKADFESRFASIQVGQRFASHDWDDFVPPGDEAARVRDFCRKYAASFAQQRESGSGLVFSGNPGTGKNMLSALIAREVVASGFTALHTTAAKLIRRIRATWGGGGDEEAAVREFTRPDLLIIDEVGVQAGTETEQRLLTEVINDRYEARAPVIILSNLDVAGLEDYLGFRVMDRLCEDGRVIPFTWESHRRRR